ncbi:MAG: class II aldolase/adducin family protein [Eubacteriales bacterium]
MSGGYMTLGQAKDAIIDIGRRMYERGMVASNDGNISVKIGESLILATPTGVSKGFMTPESLVLMDTQGNKLSGEGSPSSEIKMHLRVYREREELRGVVHAHPPMSTSFAIAGIRLDLAILTEAVVNLGVVPIARYATPGTTGVPDSIAPYVKDYGAVMLANHGPLTWGYDIYEAYYRMETLEHYSNILSNVMKLGRVNLLSRKQVEELVAIRATLPLASGGFPVCGEDERNIWGGSFISASI